MNDRIRDDIDWDDSASIDVFCECGRKLCAARIQIARDAFDDVRASPGRFVIARGHEPAAEPQDAFVVAETV